MHCVTYLNCSGSSNTLHNVNFSASKPVTVWAKKCVGVDSEMYDSIVLGYTYGKNKISYMYKMYSKAEQV